MKLYNITDINNCTITCACWDNVKTHIGTVQIIKTIDDDIQNYSEFADLLNAHGYVVVGNTNTNYGTDFHADMYDEISILEHIYRKYARPTIIIGHGYGNTIARHVMQRTKLCCAGIYMDDMFKHSKIKTAIGCAIAYLGKSICGANAQIERTIPKQINKNKITMQQYHSIMSGMMNKSDMKYTDTPILIINSTNNICSISSRLSKKLYKTHNHHELENLTFVLYPDSCDLFGTHANDIRHDVLMFLNKVRV